MSKIIRESCMDFVADNTFHIEKSEEYASIGSGVKTVEFIRTMDNKLLFVEAKKLFPDPDATPQNPNGGVKTGSKLFEEEIGRVWDKFTHSLNLYSAIGIGVVGDGFPCYYKPTDKTALRFVLVIKDASKAQCHKIAKTLRSSVQKSVIMARIWKPRVIVMNETDAVKHGIAAAKCEENIDNIHRIIN